MSSELPVALQRNPLLSTWLQFDNEKVMVKTGKVELGQGISTAIAMIAAEELDVSIRQIELCTGRTDSGPNEFMTAGSMSIEGSGSAIRQASAEARAHLLNQAARLFDVRVEELSAVSDGSGQFALRGPASHRLEIAAGAVGYLRPDEFEFPLIGDGRPGPTIALDPAAKLTGRVIDANGEGISGATVSMSEKQAGGMIRMRIGMPRAVPDAITDEQGRFRITAIDPDRDYDVKARAEGYAPAEQAVVDLQPHRTVSGITLTLAAGRAIRGSVVDQDGNAIGGVELTATTPKTMSLVL